MEEKEDFIEWMKKQKTKSASDYEIPEETRIRKRIVENVKEPEEEIPQRVSPIQRPIQRPVQRIPERRVVTNPKILYNIQNEQRPIQRKVIQEKPVLPKPLNEAYVMIDNMKKKMEGIFYRYGMIGLEKLDEALEDVIEEIMNPSPVYIERDPEPMEVPVRKKPKKHRVIRKPVVEKVPEPVIEETVEPVIEETVEPEEQEMPPTNEDFANMAANLDLNTLDAVMTKEKEMPKRITKGELDREAKLRVYESVIEAQKANDPEPEVKQETTEEEIVENNEPIEIVKDSSSEYINEEYTNEESTKSNEEITNEEK